MTLKYIFLVLSILVILVIFHKQYTIRHRPRHTENMENLKNGLCPDSSLNDFKDSSKLPLREYCIKSSFNSAYDGTTVSADTLKTRINEGYRFIDLNVFSASGDVCVGFSPDNTPTLVTSKLLLSDALGKISDEAFSKDNKLTASEYPIFVHIRVYKRPQSTDDIISKVANVINGDSTKPKYSTNYLRDLENAPIQINGCTPLQSINGKIIFSMDILNILEVYAPITNQSAAVVPLSARTAISSFVNVFTGGDTIPAFYRYTDESLTNRTNKLGIGNNALPGSFDTNVKYMYISFPHPNDTTNTNIPNSTGVIHPDIAITILYRSIQLSPMRVYLGDDTDLNLKTYIKMFDVIGKPFAPMSSVYTYLTNNVSPHPKKTPKENNVNVTQEEGVPYSITVLMIYLVIVSLICLAQYYYYKYRIRSLLELSEKVIPKEVASIATPVAQAIAEPVTEAIAKPVAAIAKPVKKK